MTKGIAMRHKTLFRMLIKAIGVWIFVMGISDAMRNAAGIIAAWAYGSGTLRFPEFPLMYIPVQFLSSLTQMALGLYLFFGGKWLVDRAIPGNRPYCPECGYDLTGAARNRCPECDTPFRIEDVRPRRSLDAKEMPESEKMEK